MAETLILPTSGTRTEIYQTIIPQIKAVLSAETDLIANLANVTAIIREALGFFWVGFYVVKGDNLVLAPFQGTLACTRIPFHKGVCGACYTQKQTIIVDDVEKFEGHIACSSASKSEIVVPLFVGDNVVAVFDIDSDKLEDFSEIDEVALEQITQMLEKFFIS